MSKETAKFESKKKTYLPSESSKIDGTSVIDADGTMQSKDNTEIDIIKDITPPHPPTPVV